MTYLDLKLYLKKNLQSPSLEFIWSEEDNKQFFTYIAKFYECFRSPNFSLSQK